MFEWLRSLFKPRKTRDEKRVNYIQEKIDDPDYDVMYEDGNIVITHYPERKVEREAFNKLSSEIKNQIGKAKGFGGCNRCGGRWNWKRGHDLKYTESRGCFPLCEECWQNTTRNEKLRYYLGHLYRYPNEDIDFAAAEKLLRKQIDDFHSSR